MTTKDLQYGQKFVDKSGKEFTLGKYWETDTDPSVFKIVLINDKGQKKSFYSSDLVGLTNEGYFSLIA